LPLRLGEENIDVPVADVLLVKSLLGTVSLFIILEEYESVTSGLAVRPVDNDVFLADTEISEEIADLTHISRVRKTTHLEASVAVFGCDKVGKTHVTTTGNSLLLAASIIAISTSILTGRSLITTISRISTTRVGGGSLLLLVTSLVVAVASTGITSAIAHTFTTISTSTVVIIVVLLISTISSALATAHASSSAASTATTTETRIVFRSAGSALMAITTELFVLKFHLLLHFKVLVFVSSDKEKLDIAISQVLLLLVVESLASVVGIFEANASLTSQLTIGHFTNADRVLNEAKSVEELNNTLIVY